MSRNKDPLTFDGQDHTGASPRIIIRKADRMILNQLKLVPSVREEAVEIGLIEEYDNLYQKHIVDMMFPLDGGEPHEIELVGIRADDSHRNRIQSLCGDSVALHDVFHEYLKDYASDHGMDVPRSIKPYERRR